MTSDDRSVIPTTADKSAPRNPDAGRARLILHTGDGRGKSSSAVGIMCRAWARDWNVAVVQFVKGPDWPTGEEKLARHLGIEWHTLGDGFTWDSSDLEASKRHNIEAWTIADRLLHAGEHDLLILDELTYLIVWGWLDEQTVLEAVRTRHECTHVVITGRDAPPALIDLADTVTEMRNLKHAFDAGIPARKGLEY